jgi:tripartite-type tricarboxylate transporter receptor subunit TctC
MSNVMRLIFVVVTFLGTWAAHAATPDWPQRPIRYIVPFAPGGATDLLARMVTTGLTKKLGQPVVRETQAGQGGSIGAAELAKASPDGYTLGAGTIGTHGFNPGLYANLPYDPIKNFAPITMLAISPNVLVVHPALNVNTVTELIALLKANPNKYSFGSSGNGTSQHIAGEMFRVMTNTQFQHVPYHGSGPMLIDLLAGTIQFSFENVSTALPEVAAGNLIALAVTTATRSMASPDIPTMQEAGLSGYDINSWQAMFAPAGTSPVIIRRLQVEVADILKQPENAQQLAKLGMELDGRTPEQLAMFLAVEVPRLAEIVRKSGAKARDPASQKSK